MRKLLLITTAALAISMGAQESDTRNIWECNSGHEYGKAATHMLYLVEDGANSYIKFYNERIPANYDLIGLNRIWQWDNYNIYLYPTNKAGYFDFTRPKKDNGLTASIQTFQCTQIQEAKISMEDT